MSFTHDCVKYWNFLLLEYFVCKYLTLISVAARRIAVALFNDINDRLLPSRKILIRRRKTSNKRVWTSVVDIDKATSVFIIKSSNKQWYNIETNFVWSDFYECFSCHKIGNQCFSKV